MKIFNRLLAFLVTFLLGFGGVSAAPQYYDLSGNPVVSVDGATFTTVITQIGAQPICPGGTAANPGVCKIISVTVGCVINVVNSCTGTLAANNVGGIFDAVSSSYIAPSNEILPIGALGSGTFVTPWGAGGYQCQVGCLFEVGAALTNGVAVFISGAAASTTTQAGGSSPTPTPVPSSTATATAAPTNAPTITPTNAPTNTPTSTPTNAPTGTPTSTPTNTPTGTPTNSPTGTPTNSPTATPTPTPTPAPTATPTAVPITESPNPIVIPNAGSVTVAAQQGANTSLTTASSNTAAFTLPAQYTNNGQIVINGTAAGGSGFLNLGGQNGAVLAVPVSVATPTPAPTATPYPISAANGSQSSTERTLLTQNPSFLSPGREGSGTTLVDTSTNALTGSVYGANITWAAANYVAPSAGNYSPVYPGPEATDAPANFATTPVSTANLQPTLSMAMHQRLTPTSEPNSTFTMDYGYQSDAPYLIGYNSTGYPQCVWRGYNAAGTAEAIGLTSPDLPATGNSVDVMCSTNGTTGWMTLDGELVTSVTETSATYILTSLRYNFNTTRGLTLGSTQGATASVTAPLSANFVGQISQTAVFPNYIAPPASSTDSTSFACSVANAAVGYPAGTPCVWDGSGAPASGPPAVTLQNSAGTTVTSIALTYPTAQVFTIEQPGYTSGYTIGTAPAAGVNAVISSGNQLTLTPTTNAAGSTSIKINGNGGVSLIINIGKAESTAFNAPPLPRELAWLKTGF